MRGACDACGCALGECECPKRQNPVPDVTSALRTGVDSCRVTYLRGVLEGRYRRDERLNAIFVRLDQALGL